jgi:hypothetical protein
MGWELTVLNEVFYIWSLIDNSQPPHRKPLYFPVCVTVAALLRIPHPSLSLIFLISVVSQVDPFLSESWMATCITISQPS